MKSVNMHWPGLTSQGMPYIFLIGFTLEDMMQIVAGHSRSPVHTRTKELFRQFMMKVLHFKIHHQYFQIVTWQWNLFTVLPYVVLASPVPFTVAVLVLQESESLAVLQDKSCSQISSTCSAPSS
jgi:hypothetical protein